MNSTSENNGRIAKNTILLYLRMFLIMAVTLYTSRVILNVLGIEDFGIYNVVGGIVTMLSFFNNSMATSTQRFLNYEMGKEDKSSLQIIFSSAINVHYIIGIVTVIALETIGLWFVYNKLNIPSEQFNAAIWVFHFSVLSLFISIISTPYNAAIIANEKMGIFAYLSILEVILKLIVVYILLIIPYNKLIIYGFLQLVISFSMRLLYTQYCIKNFKECKYKMQWERKTIKQMFSFTGWMICGCISSMLSSQGVNILINMFFGPIFNAARAIAVQVQHAVNSFNLNFMTAVKPQIIKYYSSGNYEYMYKLVFTASKCSFFLLFILTLPILLYTENILELWLGIVPEYAALFTRLVLIELLISSAYNPIAQINQASGKIKNYQMSISYIYFFNFFITYILYKWGAPVYSTFINSVILAFIGLLIRVNILRKENKFPAKYYLLHIMLPLLPIAAISTLIPLIIKNYLGNSIIMVFTNCIFALICSIILIWFIGLNKSEKKFINDKLSFLYNKIKI